MSSISQYENILFFDGICNLCNHAVDFFIKRDKGHLIYYAPLQGKTAKKYLPPKYIDNLSTVILYQNGIIYTQSEAVIRALIVLGPKYALSSILLVIPSLIRDFIYNLISKNRYKIFGKKNNCRIPSLSEKKLFLD